jgi:hypothetical protein
MKRTSIDLILHVGTLVSETFMKSVTSSQMFGTKQNLKASSTKNKRKSTEMKEATEFMTK